MGWSAVPCWREARGEAIETVGVPTFRPYVTPVAIGVLAGREVGQHYKSKRRTALHDWHERAGAVFLETGLWLRPLYYTKTSETGWDPILREARAVRRSVGICDVSTLGKIDVQGRDAAAFLDRLYINTFSTLPVGRARYGVMLREDGMVFDDGTTSRLGEHHFLMTTTTANAAAVLEHMEYHAQVTWPDLDVQFCSVTRPMGADRRRRPQRAQRRLADLRRRTRSRQCGLALHGGGRCAHRRMPGTGVPRQLLGRAGL